MTPVSLQSLTNPVPALGSRNLKGGGRDGSVPQYGMTMWFNVLVPGLDGASNSLGSWSGCTGLEVQLKPEGPVEEGGNYGALQYLPGRITYPEVTLERAMTAKGAEAVHEWMQKRAEEWAKGEGPTNAQDQSIVVELRSGLGAGDVVIHRWTLQNAIPVKWALPALSSAGGGGIAMEKLSFVHGGFLKGVELAGGAKFTLAEKGAMDQGLTFQYNPAKLTYGKSREKVDKVDRDSLKIALDDLRLEGCAAINKAIPLLEKWVKPRDAQQSSATAPGPAEGTTPPACPSCAAQARTAGDTTATGSPTLLEIKWGQLDRLMPKELLLKGFEMNFTRFTPDARPSRASVKLTLQVYQADANGASGAGKSAGKRSGGSTGARP